MRASSCARASHPLDETLPCQNRFLLMRAAECSRSVTQGGVEARHSSVLLRDVTPNHFEEGSTNHRNRHLNK